MVEDCDFCVDYSVLNVLVSCPQALLQMVQSHDGSIRSVVEKGDALLASVHYPSIRDKMNRLQRDYNELCKRAVVRTYSEVTLIHAEKKECH